MNLLISLVKVGSIPIATTFGTILAY
ncbi:protein of unknown function [Candidatus Methylomirabilis oxygeniifera]|uniref:Uncharacterized protein n=1 Tax=Methylomirabilis oxygeniifera TaxID=671143 RepID=D5MJD6_METO1|nr:protein of unknown function [Candidatus Methylomirabilis oxyfera]